MKTDVFLFVKKRNVSSPPSVLMANNIALKAFVLKKTLVKVCAVANTKRSPNINVHLLVIVTFASGNVPKPSVLTPKLKKLPMLLVTRRT